MLQVTASLSWCRGPLGVQGHMFVTVAGLWVWGDISDEKKGLSFTIYPSMSKSWH
jgi:hypothetical protein